MEQSKVYFTDFRTIANGDGLPTKLKKLIKKAGIADLDLEGKFVAIGREVDSALNKYRLNI